MLYRVALAGFAESERGAYASCLRETSHREPGYQLVALLADADVILADGDSAESVASVVDQARVPTTLFVGDRRPPEAIWHLARPTDPAQLLRGLDELAAHLELAPEVSGPADAHDAHARAKAAARGATRRARLAAAAPVADWSSDVLVLDPDDSARDHLCSLLEHFGFCAYPARNISQALWLVETREFRVAFLEVVLDGSDGGDGVELCRRIKGASQARQGSAPALFIMSGDAHPADRVRAALAGSEAFLVKPLDRGEVAGALDACGIAMPADARRN